MCAVRCDSITERFFRAPSKSQDQIQMFLSAFLTLNIFIIFKTNFKKILNIFVNVWKNYKLNLKIYKKKKQKKNYKNYLKKFNFNAFISNKVYKF